MAMAKAKKALSLALAALFAAGTIFSAAPAVNAAVVQKAVVVNYYNAALVNMRAINTEVLKNQDLSITANRVEITKHFKAYQANMAKETNATKKAALVKMFNSIWTAYQNKVIKDRAAQTPAEVTVVSVAAPADMTVENGAAFVAPKTVKATMSDNSVVDKAVVWDKTVDTKVAGTTTLTANVGGKTVSFKVTVKVGAVAVTKVAQTGTKKLTVTLNQAVENGTVTLKRGQVTVSVKSTTWNAAKNEVVVETTTNLLGEDYTVTVAGATGTVKAEEEKIGKIELKSTSAALTAVGATTAKVGYAVYNQFNEDITTSTLAASINWVVSPNATAADNDKDFVTITQTAGTWTVGESKVILTGVDTATGKNVSATVTIAEAAKVKTIDLKEVKNLDKESTDQLLNQGDTASADYFWAITFDAVDQYGNKVTAKDYFDGADNTLNTSDDPVKLNVSANGSTVAFAADPDSSTKAVIKVTPGNGLVDETVVVTAVDITSGANDSITFKVEKNATVSTFKMSQPTDLVIAGEAVVIPFEAVDQYGNAVTAHSKLTGMTPVATSGTAVWTKDPLTNKGVLKFTPATDGVAVITLTGGTVVSQLTVTANKLAVPTVIEKVADDAVLNMTSGAAATLDIKSFVVKDQYGRAIDVKTYDGNAYTVVVSGVDSTDTDVTLGGSAITTASGSYSLTGTSVEGSKTFKAELYKGASAVAGSAIEFSANSVKKSSIVEYKISDISKMFATTGSAYTTSLYSKAVTVYGYTASGAKVKLASGDIQATNVIGDIAYSAADKKILAINDNASEDNDDKTATVLVAVNGDKGVVTVRKDVTISDEAPKAVSIDVVEPTTSILTAGVEAFDATNNVAALSIATVSGLGNVTTSTNKVYFQVVDQYGVKSGINPSFFYLSEDKVTTPGTYSINNSTGVLTVGTAVANDEFTITAVTGNGITTTLKVIVK